MYGKMNILRDNKGAYFNNLSRGERVYLMMEHSYKMQRSPFRKHKRKAFTESGNIHDLLTIHVTTAQRKQRVSVFGEILP